MSRPPRHEIVGFPTDPIWLARQIAYHQSGFVGVDSYTSTTTESMRGRDVYSALEVVGLRHLEVPGALEAEPWVSRGFDAALHFFLDDWHTDPRPGDPEEEPYNLVIAARRRDKDVGWYKELSRGMILGLLSGRRDDVARLCAWPWAELVPEYSGMGGDLEDEVALMYLLVASGLRDEPMEGVERVAAKVRKSRAKRPRLLMKLWEAAEGGDQAAFDAALARSLEHAASLPRLDDRDARVVERLAGPQTAIALAAGWRGLRTPELPPELSALLITRDSIGLVD